MNKKKTHIFRTKSIEKIESPESMTDYLQVTSPGVWLVLIAIVIFLIGICFWGIFGYIDSTAKVAVISTNNRAVCLVPENALNSAIENRVITIDGIDHELSPDVLEPMVVSADTNVYWILAGDLKIGDIIYQIPLSQSLPEGVYSGIIITETLSPFSLILN